MQKLFKASFRSLVLGRNFPLRMNSTEIAFSINSSPDLNGIATVSLNRPKAMNAMNKEFINVLTTACEEINRTKLVRVLIIHSLVRGVFCAGADLKERSKMAAEDVGPHVARARAALLNLERLEVPTIVALDGLAFGGGLEVALACDIRIASEDATMGLTETKLAIIPGAGGTQRLPRIVGPAMAKELIFTARRIKGADAFRMRLANHCVPQNSDGNAAYLKALEVAKEIAANGPIALRAAKAAIAGGAHMPIEEALRVEQQCYARVIPTRDRLEGLAAFIEKRRPQYCGE